MFKLNPIVSYPDSSDKAPSQEEARPGRGCRMLTRKTGLCFQSLSLVFLKDFRDGKATYSSGFLCLSFICTFDNIPEYSR